MANENLKRLPSFVQQYSWSEPAHAEVALTILDCGSSKDRVHDCHAGSENYHHVQLLLAAHPETPPSVLEHLSEVCACPKILERIAANPSASPKILERLSRHSCAEVRAAVAENGRASRRVLERLAGDAHEDVRYRLAECAGLPDDLLDRLAADENPYVAHRACLTRQRRLRDREKRLGKTHRWQGQSRIRRVI